MPDEKTSSVNSELRDRYITLLKLALTRSLPGSGLAEIPSSSRTPSRRLRYATYSIVQKVLSRFRLSLAQTNRACGETMMGLGAMENLQQCLVDVIRGGTPGDVIETGVWRGGGTIFMKGILEAYGDRDRTVWVADSFQGLPKPDPERYAPDTGSELWKSDYLAVTEEEVRANFELYSLLDERVRFLKGFFSETMPSAPVERLALLRLDGDMYESTFVVLEHLYPKLSVGGYVIVDDFGMVSACDLAVQDYRSKAGVTEELRSIGFVNGKPLGAFWRKEK